MFFASGFDRVPDGTGGYSIHYQAGEKLKDCRSHVIRHVKPAICKAKDLWVAAGFVLCFAWVYDFSNAMPGPHWHAAGALERVK